ncbi:putative HMG box transcriptional regulator [Aspergillus clavatus NRRL 1]|uniref:HMG box transcriptional regulator, putative n=1 Tax=Aspergillus clavatus (strain ATCC 1007 / CBS 513.65 / DSM 816 / NCTC 3887 / NRRL 1 / QM 1276 / 107) TaxID=344612 RepID=A1CI22_ASPCL|nr:HMG box transcriptional regulator, putative [Aspergillus clavatus NRRL 1]EAW10527.1 HMG box transcriptional regulator, putative [Aspergillus clavatus NRRL 1]
MSYDRVLPKPSALLHDAPPVNLPRRSSNLLEHKIMNDEAAKVAIIDHPVDTASCRFAPSLPSTGLPQVHLSSLNRAKITLNKIASNPPTDSANLGAPLPARTMPLRERSSQSERSSSSSPVKSTASKDSVTHFCLCQPDPKIPRPRNAFILYRQHYQAAVVAQNPGLANPDISKIIGEQWRKLPQETKDEWKALAEEEKARHQQQYPEYRYQPRRYGRDGNSRSMSSGISHNPPGSTVCTRCGGRVMTPPVSPEAPFTPNGSSSGVSTHPDVLAARSYQYRARDGDRPVHPIRVASTGEIRPPRQRQWEESGCRSPDSKRRRFNSQVLLKPNIHRDRSPESPYPISPYTPRSDVTQARALLQMPHPSRAARQSREHPSHDPSLRLPPLQTSTPVASSMTPITPFPQEGSSLEAMVMNIPFINKIKLLSKISPPLVPSFRDGCFQRRGVVIAVDGQDPLQVRAVVDYLNRLLQKEGKYNPQVFEGPDIRPQESQAGQMGDATVDYLNTISVWHRISDAISSFVKPASESPGSKLSDNDAAFEVSPKTIIPKTAELKIGSPAQSSENGSDASSSVSSTGLSPVPIALVPRYQLTTADAYACYVPISDSYAPLDHWQWMASLWRACVGPDITVYIRDCEKDELDRFGGNPVEVRLQDARTVVVRRVVGSQKDLEEKALKRVGFEIEDFLTQ